MKRNDCQANTQFSITTIYMVTGQLLRLTMAIHSASVSANTSRNTSDITITTITASTITIFKVNSATPRRVIGMGAHLPVFGHWACRWINHSVCDVWPVPRQTYGYLSSLCRYQIYTAWWQLAAHDINPIAYMPEFTGHNFVHRPRFEPRPVGWSGQRARI